MKRNAASLVPKGTTIARFALLGKFGWEIVGKPHGKKRLPPIVSGVVSDEIAPRFNAELRSKIQFLGRRGWS